MANMSYVLARLKETQKFLETINSLQGLEKILSWNAIQGSSDLLLKMSMPASEIGAALKKLGSLSDISVFDILQANLKRNLSTEKACAYVFVEADQKKKSLVKEKVEIFPEAASVDLVSGPSDLVILIEGDNFQDIDNLIDAKILNMEGVLRIKKYRVINLKNI